ncbi:hypothetical protein KM043_010170 [Ampulex compressa]|nr:hypothetical protein KM043_010170 [Ampulex compressa]
MRLKEDEAQCLHAPQDGCRARGDRQVMVEGEPTRKTGLCEWGPSYLRVEGKARFGATQRRDDPTVESFVRFRDTPLTLLDPRSSSTVFFAEINLPLETLDWFSRS